MAAILYSHVPEIDLKETNHPASDMFTRLLEKHCRIRGKGMPRSVHGWDLCFCENMCLNKILAVKNFKYYINMDIVYLHYNFYC